MATGTLGTSEREYATRQTHYLTSGTLTGGTGGNWLRSASTKIGTLPAGASILRAAMFTSVISDAGTNKQASLGTVASGTDVVAIANWGVGTLGMTLATIAATSVPVLLAAATDLYVTNNTTGTTATVGTHQVAVEYVVNTGGTSALT